MAIAQFSTAASVRTSLNILEKLLAIVGFFLVPFFLTDLFVGLHRGAIAFLLFIFALTPFAALLIPGNRKLVVLVRIVSFVIGFLFFISVDPMTVQIGPIHPWSGFGVLLGWVFSSYIWVRFFFAKKS